MKNFWIIGFVIAVLLAAKRAKANTLGLAISNITDSLPKSPNKAYSKRSLNVIEKIIIHHSATTSGNPTAYANYHITNKGWPAIGYHFVIQKNGAVFQTNELDTISYHTSGQNSNSIGICLTGNFDIEQPSQAQVNSLRALIYGLESQLGALSLHGHNEYSTKSCPGFNFDLQTLKTLV